MQGFETLTVTDMMQIFQISRVSVYRKVSDGREGRQCGLPLPIPTRPKQRLRWNVETVRKFLENGDGMPLPSSTPPFESEAKRAARNRVALRELEKFGIIIPKKGQE